MSLPLVKFLLTTIFWLSSVSFAADTLGQGLCTVDTGEMLFPAWKETLLLLVGALPSTIPVNTVGGEVD